MAGRLHSQQPTGNSNAMIQAERGLILHAREVLTTANWDRILIQYDEWVIRVFCRFLVIHLLKLSAQCKCNARCVVKNWRCEQWNYLQEMTSWEHGVFPYFWSSALISITFPSSCSSSEQSAPYFLTFSDRFYMSPEGEDETAVIRQLCRCKLQQIISCYFSFFTSLNIPISSLLCTLFIRINFTFSAPTWSAHCEINQKWCSASAWPAPESPALPQSISASKSIWMSFSWRGEENLCCCVQYGVSGDLADFQSGLWTKFCRKGKKTADDRRL